MDVPRVLRREGAFGAIAASGITCQAHAGSAVPPPTCQVGSWARHRTVGVVGLPPQVVGVALAQNPL
jgi:hypothetical protein